MAKLRGFFYGIFALIKRDCAMKKLFSARNRAWKLLQDVKTRQADGGRNEMLFMPYGFACN
jgi:hypothetical protein